MISIDSALCRGCGLCVKTCAQQALFLENKKAFCKDSCTLCGICVDACPFHALSLPQKTAKEDLSAYCGIWVVAQCDQGRLLPVTLELLGKARQLADQKQVPLSAVLLSNQAETLARELIFSGADQVLLLSHSSLAAEDEELTFRLLAEEIERRKPEIVLFGATAFGRSVAPRLAARLRTGLTADCTQLEIDKEQGLLLQTRPAFGGNLMATIATPYARPQMATVRAGIFPTPKRDTFRTGTQVLLPFPTKKKPGLHVLETQIQAENSSLPSAQLLVVAGKGIGTKKNMKLVHRFAQLVGAQVGVSRPLVEAGWSDYRYQIGQTGVTVHPKILLSLGVSGAIQHLAGISGAETIIAVNTDPHAPIFQVADYKVQADCIATLESLIQRYESQK